MPDDETLNSRGTPPVSLLVTALATTFAIYVLHWLVQRKRFIDACNRIPGPSMNCDSSNMYHPWLGHLGPILGSVGQIPDNPQQPLLIPLFTRWSREHAAAGIFRIWAFNPYRLAFARISVTVFGPDLVRQLLESPTASKKLVKDTRVFAVAEAVVGSSLLALNDTPQWKHQRKLTAPAFHVTVLEHACRVATDLLHKTVFAEWDKAGPTVSVEAAEWSNRLATEVLGIVAFSHSFGGLAVYQQHAAIREETLYDTYQALLTTMASRLRSVSLLLSYLPTKENLEFNRHSRRLSRVIQEIIQERLQNETAVTTTSTTSSSSSSNSPDTKKDLLSRLLLRDENGERLTLPYLHGNVRMFLFAGHDTTASTLAYALWELATQPETQERLRKEVDELFESLPDGEQPTYKQYMQLRYLDAVVKETLRLHAPAGIARRAAEDITLNKGDRTFVIPKDASVYVFPLYTHLSKEAWEDRPETFVPERFLDEQDAAAAGGARQSSKTQTKTPWFPFSVGPRNCLGQSLANAELKTIISQIIRRYTVRPSKGAAEPIPILLLTIKPHQVLLDFERRPLV